MNNMSAFLLTNGFKRSLIVNGEILEFDIAGNCSNPDSIRVYRPFKDIGIMKQVNVISCLQVTGYSEVEVFCVLNGSVYRDIMISGERYDFIKSFFLESLKAKVLRCSGQMEYKHYRQTFYVFEQFNYSNDIVLKYIRGE